MFDQIVVLSIFKTDLIRLNLGRSGSALKSGFLGSGQRLSGILDKHLPTEVQFPVLYVAP